MRVIGNLLFFVNLQYCERCFYFYKNLNFNLAVPTVRKKTDNLQVVNDLLTTINAVRKRGLDNTYSNDLDKTVRSQALVIVNSLKPDVTEKIKDLPQKCTF